MMLTNARHNCYMASFAIVRAIVFALAVFGNLVTTNEVLWSEEFNGKAGSQPLKDMWTYTVGEGSFRGVKECSSSSELQYYTDSPTNVALDGQGNLVITASPEKSPQELHCSCGPCRYTSAQLVSKFKRRYGRFEARMKLPSGKGLWPAFTLLGDTIDCVGWPNTGEIDVMEMRGSRPNTILGSIHGPGYSGGISSMFTLQGGQTFEDDFHVFAIDWDANRITWSVDGDVYVSRNPDDLGQNPWVFDHPVHVLISLAVGGLFDGAPTADVKFPKQLLIDYIRVYEKAEGFSISYPIIMASRTSYGPLRWSSEFNSAEGTPPPSDQWSYDLGDGSPDNAGWGNSEHEYYTNETLNSATDGKGNLVISARKDNAPAYQCYYGPCRYTSARLKTLGKFSHQYGRYEAKVKMPFGKGLWPAFWLLGDNMATVGWPQCGTIALEMKGSLPRVMTVTIHGPGYQGNNGIQDSYTLPGGQSFTDDFHVFAVDWEPNRLTFSVDDNVFSTMTPERLNGNRWVFDHKFHIIINLAVGGGYPGYPTEDTVFPNNFTIDYIRVYDQISSAESNEV